MIRPNNKESDWIQLAQNSIAKAEREESKLHGDVLSIEGMSSPKVKHLMNNLCSEPFVKYLEIGCWRGSTFIPALFGNTVEAIAIDNLTQDKNPELQHNAFASNIKRFIPDTNFKLYETDCFSIDKSIFTSKINVYFYDGDHTQKGHESAFTFFNEVFDDVFVAVVDDWNWSDTQNGTYSAFKKLNYNVLFEKSLLTPHNCDTSSWWNGIYVSVIKK